MALRQQVKDCLPQTPLTWEKNC